MLICYRGLRFRSRLGAALSIFVVALLQAALNCSRMSLSGLASVTIPAAANFGRKTTAREVVKALAPNRGLEGRVALVTGGNSGLGLQVVKALASEGCRVILASRSLEAGATAVKDEVFDAGVGGYEVPEADVVVKQLNLADLASVVTFCNDVVASESRLDYVVLNAGVMALPNLERTVDGFEKQIGINHFGHALLMRLIRPVIEKQTMPSRVVSLASTAHRFTSGLDVDDLHFKRSGYTAWGAYGNSKLAVVLFAKGLAERVQSDKISSVSVHPGIIKTNLWRSTPAADGIFGWFVGQFVADREIPQGAATTMWACLSREAGAPRNAGAYLADCGIEWPTKTARDPDLVEALWKATERQLDDALEKRGLGPMGEKSGRP